MTTSLNVQNKSLAPIIIHRITYVIFFPASVNSNNAAQITKAINKCLFMLTPNIINIIFSKTHNYLIRTTTAFKRQILNFLRICVFIT